MGVPARAASATAWEYAYYNSTRLQGRRRLSICLSAADSTTTIATATTTLAAAAAAAAIAAAKYALRIIEKAICMRRGRVEASCIVWCACGC